MGIADTDRIDIVATAKDGSAQWIMVAGGGWPVADEARMVVQFFLKYASYKRGAAQEGKPVTIELVSADEPPLTLVEKLAQEGVRMEVGFDAERRMARGRVTEFAAGEDGWPDIDALQVANAQACARVHGLPWPPTEEGVKAFDDVLEKARTDAGLAEDEESDRPIDGNLVVLGGAYAGEVVRAAIGGRWRHNTDDAALATVTLSAGPELSYTVNLLGKVRKFLTYGPSDAVVGLVQAVIRMANEKR